MRLALAGVLLLSASLLSGCAKYWYQEGTSFTQCRRDLASCHAEAARYSDVERTSGLGGYESKFVRECMREKGYNLVGESTLPIRVKRESSPVFGIPGVAGTVD
jgi:hypothetical protein